MNLSQIEKLNELSFRLKANNLAYLKTKPEERIDSLFIAEIRKIANEILNTADDIEAKR